MNLLCSLLRLSLLLQLSAAAVHASAGSTSEQAFPPTYDEKLHLKTLPGNSVLASFRFVINGTFDNHHSVFPRSLAQILEHSGAKELHLRFALGRWDAERWGSHIWDGKMAGGTGVELWAWVEADDDAGADKRWTTLTNALSGLFCASLNFIDSTRTIRPVLSFSPSPHHTAESLQRLHLLHGSLPREPICTENLTPFLKLLPCKGKAGISSLLSGHKLFDAQWQSMSIDIAPVCSAEEGEEAGERRCHPQLIQTVDMVLDVERSLARQVSPVPHPRPLDELACDLSKPYALNTDACFPQHNVADLPWSLREIFGRPIRGTCPPASPSSPSSPPEPVCADVPADRAIFIPAGAQEHKRATPTGGQERCFSLPPGEAAEFDVVVPQQAPPGAQPFPPPPLYAERAFTGHGQERGGVQAVLTNPDPNNYVDFVYLESLPWSMKPYLHTLTATLSPPNPDAPGNSDASSTSDGGDGDDEKVIRALYYRPAQDRHRGTHLEASLRVPPNRTLVLSYAFEKAVLRYTEYPPDANRGFDVASAVITVASGPRAGFAIRTTSLLLSLPTPDFSMPYNVIILTSTVMALAFGSIFNILVRRFVAADEVPRKGVVAVRAKVVGALKGVRAKVRGLRRGEKALKTE